ncbi:hypothetical protein M3Y97_00109400 [Aphelenchoides bicaudatus]|nr:hypothetical protein M3Y97_00109400 [Aphelenchoides bicaudatus]
MLKHLLSSTGPDQSDHHQSAQQPYPQQFYPNSFAHSSTEYKYEEHADPSKQQQQSAPAHSNNNTICEPPEAFGIMDELAGFDGTSNTSDFLSSTFSLLTSDSTLVEHSSAGDWPQYAIEQMDGNKQQRVFYEPNPQLYYSQPNPYASHYGSQHDEQLHQQQMHEMQAMRQTDSAEPAEKRAKKSNGQSARNCQLEYTENFKKFINIPTQNGSAISTNSATPPQRSLSANNSDSGVQSPADSEESDSVNGGQTIQCPACKSVYSSARSLTGHIGRTEKCRELIGRDYLDEIAKMGKSGCIPDPSSVGEGISPVCPHCNRFISHYKGNIRRHVNSCKKMPGRKDSGAEPVGSNSSNASLASYDTTSTPNPAQIEDHQTQPCSSNKDHSDYALQAMHSHQMHRHQPIHAVHFAHPHPEERHIPSMNHHQLPPYSLNPSAPVHYQIPPAQNQMTLITHLQPPNHLNQPVVHYGMDYMPYEPMYHQQHMQTMPAQHYEITYVRTSPENPAPSCSSFHADCTDMPNAQKVPKLKHNGMVPVSDPYTCCWCAFSTVYKGNMKRHLISCHACTDELLRKYNFELERLRKSNPHPATADCLPFIEIKPPQPPGTRRPRNPPNNKNLGRPKKTGSTSSEKSAIDSNQQFESQPPTEYMTEPPLQYGIIPPHQLKMEYPTTPMGFMNATPPTGQLMQQNPNGNPTYIIKDCANDSGLGMELNLNDYGADVSSLHQPQALPGY